MPHPKNAICRFLTDGHYTPKIAYKPWFILLALFLMFGAGYSAGLTASSYNEKIILLGTKQKADLASGCEFLLNYQWFILPGFTVPICCAYAIKREKWYQIILSFVLIGLSVAAIENVFIFSSLIDFLRGGKDASNVRDLHELFISMLFGGLGVNLFACALASEGDHSVSNELRRWAERKKRRHLYYLNGLKKFLPSK